MNTFDCDLYMDLMPLVRDGAASRASREALEAHLRQCESCAELFASMPETPLQPEETSVQSLKKIRRRMHLTTWTVLVLAVVVGGFLTMTEGMGYNLILFPVVGVIAYCGLGAAAFRASAGVAVFSFLTLVIRLLTEWAPASMSELTSVFGFSLCYGAAFLLGVGAAWLMGYAFRKPKEDNMKNRWKQILSGVLAVTILAGVLYVCDAFMGNPISWAAARNHAQSYLLEEYPEEYLVAGDPEYDWYSTMGYFVSVSAPANPDGDFMLQYDRLGRLVEDTRESWVEGGLNTFDRISVDCQMAIVEVQAAIEDATGLSVSFALASDWPSIYDDVGYPFTPEEHIILAELEPGKTYDTMELLKNYGMLDLWGLKDDLSDRAVCEILAQVKAELDAHGIPMRWVDVGIFDEQDNRAQIATFPIDAVGSPDLEQQVHEARQAWDAFETEYEAYIVTLNP